MSYTPRLQSRSNSVFLSIWAGGTFHRIRNYPGLFLLVFLLIGITGSMAKEAPKGLTVVQPNTITKANPMPKAPFPPRGLVEVTPIPIQPNRPQSSKSSPPAKRPAQLPKPITKPAPAAPSPTAPKARLEPKQPIKPKRETPPQTAAIPSPSATSRAVASDPATLLKPHVAKYQKQLANLLRTFTDKHPDVRATRRILDQLQANPAPLSKADRDRIHKQVASCWSVPGEGGTGGHPVVDLLVALDPEGRVMEIEDADPERVSAEPRYRELSDTAKQAVRNCSPLWLPLSGFQSWRSMTLRLDANEGIRR